jgi:hypothetical protein
MAISQHCERMSGKKFLPLPWRETWMLWLAASPVSLLDGFWSGPPLTRRAFQRRGQTVDGPNSTVSSSGGFDGKCPSQGPQLWGKALTILSPRAKCFPYALLESWLQHSMRQEGNQTMNESGHLSLSSGYSLPPIYFLDGQHFLPSPVTQRSGGERSPCAAKRSRGGTTSSFHLLRSGLF